MIGLNILKRFNILINDTMFIICQLIVNDLHSMHVWGKMWGGMDVSTLVYRNTNNKSYVGHCLSAAISLCYDIKIGLTTSLNNTHTQAERERCTTNTPSQNYTLPHTKIEVG